MNARPSAVASQGPASGARIDEETGEITEPDSTASGQELLAPSAAPAASPSSAAGERSIPSVNRERSVQSRVSNALAMGTAALLGVGFLAWYYSTQFARADEAKAAVVKAAQARTAGEMKLPPLGRVDPPNWDAAGAAPASVLAAPPPPPLPESHTAAYASPAVQAPKTPAELLLERQLRQPVLLRDRSVVGGSSGADTTTVSSVFGLLPTAAGEAAFASGARESSTLAGMLRPTQTPAVNAQVLPNRRLLLPKGAFLDCTLETAIDSTFDGMVTCIGASDIYSADGKVVLLERGTKYVGEKRGELRQGQGRVFVLWNEARTPTGVVVQLASPGTDELGRTGLPGKVETHFWDRFGAAILISVIDGSLQALAASQRSGTGAVVVNPQGTRDVITEVLRSTVAVPPTVVKNHGDRIQILAARDVDFRSVYALRVSGNER